MYYKTNFGVFTAPIYRDVHIVFSCSAARVGRITNRERKVFTGWTTCGEGVEPWGRR